MDEKNRTNQTKKKKPSFLGLVAFIVIVLASSEELGGISGLLSIAGTGLLIIAGIVFLLIIIGAIAGKKKKSASLSGMNNIREKAISFKNANEAARERAKARIADPEGVLRSRAGARQTVEPEIHSHDRASGYADGSCTAEEHWKKQLDGFLANGLIDRAEYNLLMKKRTGRDYTDR